MRVVHPGRILTLMKENGGRPAKGHTVARGLSNVKLPFGPIKLIVPERRGQFIQCAVQTLAELRSILYSGVEFGPWI